MSCIAPAAFGHRHFMPCTFSTLTLDLFKSKQFIEVIFLFTGETAGSELDALLKNRASAEFARVADLRPEGSRTGASVSVA